MSKTLAAPINIFSDGCVHEAMQRYEHLHPIGGRAFGQLASIQPCDACQLAEIGGRLIVLPEALDLRAHVGHKIGICRIEEQYHIRRLDL